MEEEKVVFVAVKNYDPNIDDDQLQAESFHTAPDISSQLPFECNDRFELVGSDVGWWIYVTSPQTQQQGYVPSTLVVPLRNDLSVEEKMDLDHGAELSAHLVNHNINLKYFPGAPRERDMVNRVPCPENRANFFSKITFWWLNRLLITGFKRPLRGEDLWALNKKNKAAHMVPQIVRQYTKEKRRCQEEKLLSKEEELELKSYEEGQGIERQQKTKGKRKASLTKALAKEFWSRALVAVILKIIYDVSIFLNPQLLALIIDYTKDNSVAEWKGYFYATSMFATTLILSLILHQYFHIVFTVGMKIHSCVVGLVYRKALILNSASKRMTTAGEMVNLMSVDAHHIKNTMTYINTLWSSPLQIILALYFLFQTMGVSILAGVGVIVLLVPLNYFTAKMIANQQKQQMEKKDARIKIMNEVLGGIKILKLYAWEESFFKKITDIRNKEVKHLRNIAILNSLFYFTFMCAPFLVSFATFATYVHLGNELTASKAFVAISLFNLLDFPLTMLPYAISSAIQAGVALKRLTEFLNLEELDPDSVQREMPSHLSAQSVHVQDGIFSWGRSEKPVLKGINLNIQAGSLVAVVGQVGCGKSTLLSALLGETEKLCGQVYVQGSVGYVPQQAWIQNATLRDNILFGRMFIPKRYRKAVNACALRMDLDILPAGDLTEIGERGINLSGGQKQRVSLARAVYFDADVYLLDDPLSAVDSHVGKHIFDKVIGPQGLLKKKTRILVTHGIKYLPQVDQIVVLQDGRISEVGTYRELLGNEGAFAEFLKTYANEEKQDEKNNGEERIRTETRLERSESVATIESFSSVMGEYYVLDNEKEVDKMIEEEQSQTGVVKLSVFLTYAKALGIVATMFTLFFLTTQEGWRVGSRVWLAEWSSDNVTTSAKRDLYLGVYGALGVAQATFYLFAFVILVFSAVNASRNLHKDMLVNILHSGMEFFETTPLGRIVNRFSKDMFVIDDVIPKSLMEFLECCFSVLGTLSAISLATPIFLSVIAPLGILYTFVQRVYVASSRQLKRIESVSRSPIYNHFFESINGTSTIRAFWLQSRFIRENYHRIDENQVAYYPSMAANRWLALRMDFVGGSVIFFASLFAVISRGNIAVGLVGLSITYALQITSTLNWLVRQASELESNVVSVERVKEYSEIPTEAPWICTDNCPPDDWPSEGKIIFKEFDIRYREGLPLVLRNIDCTINPGEKIGIVGRTGAGKTSLTLALFRILESAGGKIIIDGVDVSTIGLHDLRSRLTIIPQDPVLFSGTLRLNLDPFDKYSDQELWHVLEVSQLKTFVSGLDHGLQHIIAEGGENLSVGQRQLVCLARALLRKSKILVLDEATAAVDLETDEIIQRTIRGQFSDKTVLTIAHRLNTIMDYTKVIVLDRGFIAEFDTPLNLLARQGIFYSMAHDAGLA